MERDEQLREHIYLHNIRSVGNTIRKRSVFSCQKCFAFSVSRRQAESAASAQVCAASSPETAHLQDELVRELIGLAEAATAAGQRTPTADRLLADGLFTTLTNVNFDNRAIAEFTARVRAERDSFGGAPCKVVELWKGDTDTVSLRSTLLFGMKGMAAYAHHAMNLGYVDDEVSAWFYKGLCAVNRPHSVEEWLALIVDSDR